HALTIYPRVTPKRVDRAVLVPAPVHVPRAALVTPHVAELRVAHRLTGLAPRGPEIPRRPREGAVADSLVVGLPAPAGQVVVPGVEIGLGVAAAAAHGVVFDEARGIERLGQTVIAHAPMLGRGEMAVG